MPISTGKRRLAAVLRNSPQIVTVDSAASALQTPNKIAAKILARWVEQGWLMRITRRVYVPLQLGASTSGRAPVHPWTLVRTLFGQSIISGWSAAQHWDLTEQIFDTTIVLTNQPVRSAIREVAGIKYHIKHISSERLFGTKTFWIESIKTEVADPHRTILDMIEDPAIGGGIEHVTHCLRNYIRSDQYRKDELIQYLSKMNNGSINKRLGFILSKFPNNDAALIKGISKGVTKGYVKLDPALECPRIVRKWNIRVPESWIDKK